MTGWYTFSGFDTVTEKLIFEDVVSCDPQAVRDVLDPESIADDLDLLYCYPLSKDAVAALTNRTILPEGDYFVNAAAAPENTPS